MNQAATHFKQGQEAIDGVRSGRAKSVRGAAMGLESHLDSTLSRQSTDKTQSRMTARAKKEPLSAEQEDALVSWTRAGTEGGQPLAKQALVDRVEEICGRTPTRRWICRFLRRHPDCRLAGANAAGISSEDESRNATSLEIVPYDPSRARDIAMEVDPQPTSSSSMASSDSPPSSFPSPPADSSSESELDEDSTMADELRVYKAKAARYKKQRDEARSQCEEISARAESASQHIQSILAVAGLSANPVGRNSASNVSTLQTEAGYGVLEDSSAMQGQGWGQAPIIASDVLMSSSHRTHSQRVFSGTLQSQDIDTLRDIAQTLTLPSKGTREVLIAAVSAHLFCEANEHLRGDVRFAALFAKRAGKRPAMDLVADASTAHGRKADVDGRVHQRRRLTAR